MPRWTGARIAEHIPPFLCDGRLLMVSNREPYIHRWDRQARPDPPVREPSFASKKGWNGEWVRRWPSRLGQLFQRKKGPRWSRPAGGLTAALDPVMQACHGTWVAWGSGHADREAVNPQDRVQVPPNDPQYTLRRVWLSEAQVRGFYEGFANSALWPLCHLQLERAVFNPIHWRHYQEVNARFAEAVAEECEGGPATVWIQDYHLALCPAYLRQRVPTVPLMHFWHIPWPPWELYRVCPWRRELVEGLLGNDLLGFQLEQHCKNFLECTERVLGAHIDYKAGLVEYGGRETWVRPFPISIDYDWWTRVASERRVGRRIARLRTRPPLAFPVLGLGVDRLDYTKGIVSRLEAIERFLEKYPEVRGRFGFVQIAVPSRTQLAEYRRVKEAVEHAVARINQRFGSETSRPIHYRYEQLEPAELVAYYRMADFIIISSEHDGMNLVAKEFVASQVERQGVLICSEFAGAAEQLNHALLINPYDIERVADTLKQAIDMFPEERAQRMARLQAHVAEHNIYKWLADIFTELDRILRGNSVAATPFEEGSLAPLGFPIVADTLGEVV